jgi:AcrR family transcriptional regulator
VGIQDRKQREREARRQALLAAAATVFADHGIEDATIEMIAREAEVAVGTIYLYFCSRDHLYLSLNVERLETLRRRYRGVKVRNLGPLEELRAIAAEYLAYLGESRGLFMAQLSVAHSKLKKRLRRKVEIDTYARVAELCRELFRLWESSVARVHDSGLMPSHLGATRAAAVLWAALNGAFLLAGEEDLFREMTGVSPELLCEQSLEFQLGREIYSPVNGRASRREKNGSDGIPSRQRSKKVKENISAPVIAQAGIDAD